MRRSSDGTRASSLLLLLLLLLAATTWAQEDPSPEWSQYAGNAARTSAVAVEPIRGEPKVAWTADLAGDLQSNVVTCKGVVFVAAGGKLYGFDVKTGESRGVVGVPRTATARLAVDDGTLVVLSPDQIRGLRHTGTSFKSGWMKRGDFAGYPCVFDGVAFVATPRSGVVAYDLRSGKAQETTAKGSGTPSVVAELGGRMTRLYSTTFEFDEGLQYWFKVHVTFLDVDAEGKKPPQIGSGHPDDVALVDDAAAREAKGVSSWPPETLVVEGGKDRVSPDHVLFCLAGTPLLGTDVNLPAAALRRFVKGPRQLLDLAFPPAVVGDRALGFTSGGRLVSVGYEVDVLPVPCVDPLPAGVRPGPVSAAGDVLYLGACAIDPAAGRVLWSRPDLDVVGCAIPAADRVLVVVTTDRKLICLVEEEPKDSPR